MNIFQFVFYIGVISIVYSFIWKWIIALPLALLSVVFKFENGRRVIKLIGLYLSVSLVALLTLVAVGEGLNVFKIITYPLIGSIILFFGYINNQYEARKEAYETNNFDLIQLIRKDEKFDLITALLGIVFYIFALFIPSISYNFITELLFRAVDWIYNLPIIGWIIGLGGILFFLRTVFQSIIYTGALIATVFNKEERVEKLPENFKLSDEKVEEINKAIQNK